MTTICDSESVLPVAASLFSSKVALLSRPSESFAVATSVKVCAIMISMWDKVAVSSVVETVLNVNDCFNSKMCLLKCNLYVRRCIDRVYNLYVKLL